MSQNPSTIFYWNDWENDPALRLCSMAAQALWMRMLCIAARNCPIGYVAVNGRMLDGQDLARLTGVSVPEAENWLQELERNGVFSRDRKGAIYCRRMVRDAKKAAVARINGKKGGNPALKKAGNQGGGVTCCSEKRITASVNPRDKPGLKPPLLHDSNNPPISPRAGAAAPPDDAGVVDSEFEKFWQVFPAGRKQDKLKALRMFRQIVCGRRGGVVASAGDLLAAAERYAAARAGQDPQFTKAPCNWLKDGAWFDDDPGSRRPPKVGVASGAPTRDGPPDPAFEQQMRRVLGDAGYEAFKARQRGEDVGPAIDQPDHSDGPSAQPMERADDPDALPTGDAATRDSVSAEVWSPPPLVDWPPALPASGEARLNDDALMNAWRQHGGWNGGWNNSLTITGG